MDNIDNIKFFLTGLIGLIVANPQGAIGWCIGFAMGLLFNIMIKELRK